MRENMKNPENTDRKQKKDTRFKPGQSGNPAGKPPGTRHKTTLAAQSLLDGEGKALTRKAVELALEGDMAALRLCLERILPPSRERPISIDLPDTSSAKGISLAAEAILQAIANGELLPAEGTLISNIVEKRGVALETQEFEQRLCTGRKEMSKASN
jgi:hypothetical protein